MRSVRHMSVCWWVDVPLSYVVVKVQHVLCVCVVAFLVKNKVIVSARKKRPRLRRPRRRKLLL